MMPLSDKKTSVQMPLTGKVALVTGATRGIGLAIAQIFAKNGAKVIVGGRSNNAKEVANKLPNKGHMAWIGSVDDINAIDDVREQIGKRYDRLDVLVNNAGVTKFIPHNDLVALTDELFDDIYRINLRSVFSCVRSFQPLLAKNSNGLIINISSIAAHTAVGSNVAYCAMKSALLNMTASLARALAPDIRVVAISPGLIDTEFTKGFGEYREEQINKNPLKRLGCVDDIANTALGLATYLNYINGTDIVVDGGRKISG